MNGDMIDGDGWESEKLGTTALKDGKNYFGALYPTREFFQLYKDGNRETKEESMSAGKMEAVLKVKHIH